MTRKKKPSFCLICFTTLIAVLLCGTAIAQAAVHELIASGTTMGTVKYNVRAFDDGAKRDEFGDAIMSALELVNDRMSTYKPDSEVSRFNSSDDLEWFPVSPETAFVVKKALEVSVASEGAFDVTVGPLVNLWKFGPDKSNFQIPSDTQISEQKKRVGFENLRVRVEPPSLRKTRPGIEIDLSAIAKGYAVDLVADALNQLGIESYLIEVGGEVRARGYKLDGSSWTVGIEEPVKNKRSLYYAIPLNNQSLASSGDYRNFRVVGTQKYSHNIDPRTGKPIEHNVVAVSVLADDCVTADAVATALMVLGAERGLEVASKLNTQALIIKRETTGFSDVSTAAFPDNIAGGKENTTGLSFVSTMAAASIVFLIVVAAMSVGVVLGGRRIRGSCGGIAALDNPDVQSDCAVCSAPTSECRQLKKELKRRGQK